MSASLVGSEMCIRDRVEAFQEVKAKIELGEAPGCKITGCTREQAEDSVSYTHLTLPTICSV
eukprot:10416636-Alexandrium_andersonii.AAC.1